MNTVTTGADMPENNVDPEIRSKQERAAAVLSPFATRYWNTRVRVKLKGGEIDDLSFKQLSRRGSAANSIAFPRVLFTVQHYIATHPFSTLVFDAGELKSEVLKFAPLQKKTPSLNNDCEVSPRCFSAEFCFQNCQDSKLDELARVTIKHGHVRSRDALRLLVEDCYPGSFETVLNSFQICPKGASMHLTQALRKQKAFVRGPFTMSLVKFKTEHRTWSHGVVITKRGYGTEDTATSIEANVAL